MLRRTALKPKKRLNHYSKKRVALLNEQKDVRVCLCLRAGGTPLYAMRQLKFNDGTELPLWTVTCTNGICGICHQRKSLIEPHEEPHRSQGGKVGKDSIMSCRECHNKQHPGPKLSWLK